MAMINYKAEQLWISEWVQFANDLELPLQVQKVMEERQITLDDAFDVLENGTVIWAERGRENCEFMMTGRNCDEEEIQVYGRFSSTNLRLEVLGIEKHRR